MSPIDPFERRLVANWPPHQWCDLSVLVGVSGGADSVALLHGLARIRLAGPGRLLVAHFHHGLRGAAADQDAEFVRNLAQRLGLSCHIGVVEGASRSGEQKASELTLRRERYRFFRETAHQCGARYVAVAHTADDQAETVLHRLIRGTGLAGLAGIPRIRPLSPAVTLIRPLLTLPRQPLRHYLERLGESFREDGSNADLRYTRNRIRRRLLPRLAKDYNPQVVPALTRLASQAAEAHVVMESLARDLLVRTLLASSPDQVRLDPEPLRSAPLLLVRESLLLLWREKGWPLGEMTAEHWNELAQKIVADDSSGASRTDFPGRVRVSPRNDAGWVVLERSDGLEVRRTK
ncbi:MAG: tRNA lysidine(34) synthetase TilS [Pirellulales bacterium]